MRNLDSRFSVVPQIDVSRSKFSRNSSVKTSFNVGELIPFYMDEVLPGDTFQLKTNLVCRLQPLVTAPMDNLYLDTYYFFVPNRLVWSHWRNLMGENTESAWIPTTEYSVPQVQAPAETGWKVGSLADYFGIPIDKTGFSVSALPFRAYALIVNEWFRDQNLVDPLNVNTDDATIVGSNGTDYITDCVKGGKPFIAAKLHDYFTSCLPAPQKGNDVSLGNFTGFIPLSSEPVDNMYARIEKDGFSMSTPGKFVFKKTADNKVLSSGTVGFNWTGGADGTINLGTGTATGVMADSNLGISLTDLTVNSLRTAFQLQRMLEKDARGGTRYTEIIKSHFGVTSPDARLQRPEYLGGKRIPINVNQVIQTSGTTSTSPQGTVAGYSLTADSNGDFIQSFTEHGLIIGLCVARYEHTYQEGLNKYWTKKNRTDFYLPVLANIGEQPVMRNEIWLNSGNDSTVFGYQEAWADYRYKTSTVTGEMRSAHSKSLDSWHFADSYLGYAPSLSAGWIQEDKSNVDRCLAVKSEVSNQLFADFFIENMTTRPMPLYSVPGLLDHN